MWSCSRATWRYGISTPSTAPVPIGRAATGGFYINGYVTARNAERGAWAFRNGIPCPLGDPVLIHYEDLYDRPEPHYVDAR
jgi:hypothetical protein